MPVSSTTTAASVATSALLFTTVTPPENLAASAGKLPAGFVPPAFSWDTLPIFFHSAKNGNMTDSDYQHIANNFPLATMAGFRANEERIKPFAEGIKSYNKNTSVLYYQNTLLNFGRTELSKKIPENLLLHDSKGKLVMSHGCGGGLPAGTIFDQRKAETRKWWVENIVNVTKENPGMIDGVFCDRGGPNSGKGSNGKTHDIFTQYLHCYDLPKKLADEWDDGHWKAISETFSALYKIIPNAIVIGNHASPSGGNFWNGKMFENFVPITDVPYKPNKPALEALMDGFQGQINEVHVDGCTPGSTLGIGSLAAFLIGAKEYDYYYCSGNGKSWAYDGGWNHVPADYKRPLGKPLSKAKKSGDLYSRKFDKGAEVYLHYNLETSKKPGNDVWGNACIKWGDGHITGDKKMCDQGKQAEAELVWESL